LDRPLDYQTLQLTGTSDESSWPAEFRAEGDDHLVPADLGNDHFVLARRSAEAKALHPC
jgi:peptide/nickel transport system ATP-binding protein